MNLRLPLLSRRTVQIALLFVFTFLGSALRAQPACQSPQDLVQNDSFESAPEIPLREIISGQIGSSTDQDYYKFNMPNDGVISIRLRNAQTNYKIALYNESKQALQGFYPSSPPSGSSLSKSVAAGTYYVRISTSFGVFHTGQCYDLSIVPFTCDNNYDQTENNSFDTAAEIPLLADVTGQISPANDIDMFKFDITSVSNINIRIQNVLNVHTLVLYRNSQAVATTFDEVNYMASPGTYYVRVKTAFNDIDSYCYSFKVITTPICAADYDRYVNNAFTTATGIPLNTNINGAIVVSDDVDYYKFKLSSDGPISVQLQTLPADYDLLLYNSSFQQVAISTNTGTQNESIDNYQATAGIYYLAVRGVNGVSNNDQCYTLHVGTESAADCHISYDKNPNDSFTTAVTIPLATSITGLISPFDDNDLVNNVYYANDDDYYKFDVTNIGMFNISLQQSSGRLILYNSSTQEIDRRDNPLAPLKSIVKNLNPGTYYIRVDVAEKSGGTPWPGDALNCYTLTVSPVKANQTITFPLITPKKIGDASFSLNASASSGLPVQLTSGDTSIVTISGNTAAIVGLGTVVITATQAGNETYNAATPATQTLVVNKADQTITFPNPGDKNSNDSSFLLSATSTSGLPITYSTSTPEQITISNNLVQLTGVTGTAKIKAEQLGNAQYNAAPPVEVTFLVKWVPVIKWFNSNWLESSATSGNQWYKDGVAIPGATSRYQAASPGTYTVQVIIGSYITGFSSSLVVTENNQTITFPELPYLAVGALMDLDTIVTASSGLPVTYVCNPSIATINGSIVTAVAEGTVQIMASQPGNEQYNPANNVFQFLTVSNRIPQTITFDLQEEAFVNDGPITLTATASSGLPVSYEIMDEFVARVSGNTLTLLRSGIVHIIATQEGDSIYNTAQQQMRLLMVKKSNQTISFPTLAPKTIGDAPFPLNASASSGLPVKFISGNTSIVTISGGTATIVGTGTVMITASQAGNQKYNAAVSVKNELTVDKLSQTITFTPLNEAVNGTPLELIATASSGLPVSFGVSASIPDSLEVATISGNTLTPTAAGTVEVVAYQTGNGQYKSTSTFQLLTIINGRISADAANSNVEAYPNIVKDILFVDVSDDIATTISLYNNLGVLISSQSGQGMIELDMRACRTGKYMLVIQTRNQTVTKQLIKE